MYLQSGDHVPVEIMQYKESKVLFWEGFSQIFIINPSNRKPVDVCSQMVGFFASGAKRSEVYLLRGSNLSSLSS